MNKSQPAATVSRWPIWIAALGVLVFGLLFIAGGGYLATLGGSLWRRMGFSDIVTAFLAMDSYVELHEGGIVPLERFVSMPYDKDILVRLIVKPSAWSFIGSILSSFCLVARRIIVIVLMRSWMPSARRWRIRGKCHVIWGVAVILRLSR